jgi:hypothetical protein
MDGAFGQYVHSLCPSMRGQSRLADLVLVIRRIFRRWLCAGIADHLNHGSSILLSSIRSVVGSDRLLWSHGYSVNPVCGHIVFRSEITNNFFSSPLAQIVVVFFVA